MSKFHAINEVDYKMFNFIFKQGIQVGNSYKGAFTNYVYKKRGVGGQKNQLFVNFYTIEIVNGGG